MFAASDSMAAGVYKAVQEHGLCIPDDIAVVGFDDNPEFSFNSPPLTTVRQPVRQLGIKAAELLLRLLRDNATPENIILEPQLIVRHST